MRFAKLAIAVVSFAYAMFGQTGGVITGVVSDPAGAVVPNAPVEAKNTNTGVVTPVATSATGNYQFADLPAGTYEINVAVSGFKKYVLTGVTVQQLQTTRVDVVLVVGAAAESVTVNDVAPLLQTESADITHNVTTNIQDDLPMGSIGAIRVSTEVLNTIPGVNGGTSINGAPATTERIRIDGLDATYTLGNVYYSFGAPSVDSLQEVAVQTSNYAAEYGQSTGAVLSFTMRSGTNQFHGSLYEYLENEAFNSYGAYSHTRPGARGNDYGGTVGGPVWIPKVYNGRNKTFFFFSLETHPTSNTFSNTQLTVPTAQYQVGNFSAAEAATANKNLCPVATPGCDPLGNQIIQNSIYDPSTQRTISTGPFAGDVVRTAFQNNTIPATQLDKVALNVQKLIPQPQGSQANNLIGNYINPYTTKAQDHIPSIKIDHSVSSKIKLSYNWGEVLIATPGPPTNPTAEGFPTLISGLLPSNFLTRSNRLNYDQTLKPTLLLHLGGSFVKSSLSMPPAVTGYNPTTGIGLTGPFTPLEFPPFTALLGANNTGGSSNLGNASGIDGEQLTLEEKTNFNANLTWVRNNHTYKFGGEASIEGYPNYNVLGTNGIFNFSAAETGLPYLNATTIGGNSIGLPYASFLLGLVDNYQVDSPAVGRLGKHQVGFFAQDSWKVTRKFTLDYGLRYDYSTAGSKEQYGRIGFFDPSVVNTQDGGHLGGVTYGVTCGCGNNFSNSYKLGLGPRLGVAYQLNSKTVFRAGAALLIGTTADVGIEARQVTSVNQVNSTSFAQAPMTLATGVPLTYAQVAWPNFGASHFPVVPVAGTPGAPPNAGWIDRNAGYPSKSYQWSVGVQREIVRNLVVNASYVANRGVWLQSSGAVNYNANTPQALLADGLDITQLSARNILAAQIGSVAAGSFQNKLPYAGFPLTSTVAQALRPYPQFTSAPTPLWAPLGDNWYESLQVRVIKRLSHGLDLTYNFTWSKTLQNGVEGTENDPFNRGLDKYLSGSDRPLVSNILFTYTVPAAPWTDNKVLKQVLKDWTMGGLLTYASGTPIAVPAAQTLLATQTFETASYLNRVPGQPLFLQDLNCHCFDPTKTLTLNPNAWVSPAAGTWGNSPAYYNDYRSQRHPSENFNVGRTFRFRESMSLNVRAEFVNIFNRTVLPAPSSGTPLTGPTCYLSGVSGATGACSAGAAYASGFGFESTNLITGGVRTGQLVARFRF